MPVHVCIFGNFVWSIYEKMKGIRYGGLNWRLLSTWQENHERCYIFESTPVVIRSLKLLVMLRTCRESLSSTIGLFTLGWLKTSFHDAQGLTDELSILTSRLRFLPLMLQSVLIPRGSVQDRPQHQCLGDQISACRAMYKLASAGWRTMCSPGAGTEV